MWKGPSMGTIKTIDDAKDYIQMISRELEDFSEGGEVVTVVNESRESLITAGLLRHALKKRAVILDIRDLYREGMTPMQHILEVYAFWRRYIEEHGPVAYCFGLTTDDLQEWDEAESEMQRKMTVEAKPEAESGLFARRYEALRGVTTEELSLLVAALHEMAEQE